MAYEKSLLAQDASLNPVAFALPSSASASTYSTAVDLGAFGNERPPGVQFEISVPALTDTMIPSSRTVTYLVQDSDSATHASGVRTILSETFTGAGSGIAATVLRCAIPPDCRRYVRFGVTLGASTTDSSAVDATPTLRF